LPYTTSAKERDIAVANLAYISEGVACYVAVSAQDIGPNKDYFAEIYRLFNPQSGEHFYTASAAEAQQANPKSPAISDAA
jgi:hypothetical protein